MKRFKLLFFLLLTLFVFNSKQTNAQIDTTFWFAASWVTPDHADNEPMAFLFSTFNNLTTIRLRQPAGTYDTTFTVAANSLFSKRLEHIVNDLESKPADQVLNTGFEITSDFPIIVVYDFLSSANNPETYSLKGQNGMGYEFVTPFQTRWRNQGLRPMTHANPQDRNGDGVVTQPKQQFSVVATEDNTTIYITPKCDIIGHPAGVTFSVFLPLAGNVYTCENLVQNTNVAGNNLSGTIVVSNKKIAVTCTDDSVRSSGGGCYDLMGDQIVPTDVVGKDYTISKGDLQAGGAESFFVVATENFTTIVIDDGVGPPVTQLMNQGDTYAYEVTQPLTYATSDKNVYLLHATGYGCEMGEALIPPLNCAGSERVSFTRNKPQTFFITITCPAGSEGNFTLTTDLPNPITIPVDPSSFDPVPGTGGAFVGDTIMFPTSEIGVNASISLSNSTDFFALGIFDGGASGGVLYHYLSSFLRRVIVDAGEDVTQCSADGSVDLNGSVSGGTTTGKWNVLNGSGTLNTPTNLSTTYDPVQADYDQGFLTFVLESTGNCEPEYDTLEVTFIESATITAGPDDTYCKNNVGAIPLTGSKEFAVGSEWTGGDGGAFDNSGSLNTTYTPSPNDLSAGSVTLYLRSDGSFFSCPDAVDSTVIVFTDPPVVIVGPDRVVCGNDSLVDISGTVTGVTTTGIWTTSGGGDFDAETDLITDYLISQSDTANGSVTVFLTSTQNLNCLAVTSSIDITIIDQPVVNITSEDSLCANVSILNLEGEVTPGFSTVWDVDGFGTITNDNSLITTYNVVPTDPVSGFIDVFLETNGGICPVERDSLRIEFVAPPVVFAGNDLAFCNNELIELNGTLTGTASSASWSSTGTGDFVPSSNLLSTFYAPSASDYSNGGVQLLLTSSADFGCNPDVDDILITYKSAPSANYSYTVPCLGEETNFEDLSSASEGTIIGWEYDFGDNITAISPDAIHVYNGAGIYNSSLIVTGSNGCIDTANYQVYVNPNPEANFNFDIVCIDAEASFIDNSFLSAGNITNWEWSTEDGSVFSTNQNAVNEFTESGIMPVTLTVTSDSLCSNSITQDIEVLPGPVVDFDVNPSPALVGENVVFTDLSTPVPLVSWFWDFGDGEGTSGQNVTHQYADGGSFNIVLVATDELGCRNSALKEIEISLGPALPTAFSPNGDGDNDVFLIRGGPFDAVDFKIYNNWGQLIFQSSSASIGWDGTFNLEDAPLGVYTWTYTVVLGSNTITKEGDVTLIR
jgi:gliding motility-associated-like protein